jgi:hypothetical protein
MTKKLLLAATIAVSSIAYGQVGINTATPKATLDVTSTPADLTKTDGFIAPRLTGTELKAKDANYDVPQTGTIIYVTQALLPIDTTTKTANVTAVGYYYFDGSLWKALTSGGQEPWNISGTNTQASANTQDIYQMGKVGIGVNPGTSPAANLQIMETTSSGDTGNSTGVDNTLISNKLGFKFGFNNQIYDSSTSGSFSTYGLNNSITASPASSGSSSYYGVNNSINLSDRNISQMYAFSTWPTITANTNDVTASYLRSYNTILIASASAGESLTVSGDIKGAQLRVTLAGAGNITSFEAIGLDGALYTQDAGVRNITYGAGLRSQINLTGTAANNKFTNLYGLHINRASRNATPANAYGIYIDDFTFSGGTAATSYNLYSKGVSTKNYFEGRVGIGVNAPAAPLHVVKQASDLTPAIIEGCSDLPDNAAAIAAGLPIGALYRTGDFLKVVH